MLLLPPHLVWWPGCFLHLCDHCCVLVLLQYLEVQFSSSKERGKERNECPRSAQEVCNGNEKPFKHSHRTRKSLPTSAVQRALQGDTPSAAASSKGLFPQKHGSRGLLPPPPRIGLWVKSKHDYGISRVCGNITILAACAHPFLFHLQHGEDGSRYLHNFGAVPYSTGDTLGTVCKEVLHMSRVVASHHLANK